MRTIAIRLLALAACVALSLSLGSCTRNEAPVKRSNSRSAVDHLLIKEVFYIGHEQTKEINYEDYHQTVKSLMDDDQYIILYNPTDHDIYLDGLALCFSAIDPAKDMTFAARDDFRRKYFGAGAIMRFPGTGNQYPVHPKDSVIIAKNAVDYEKAFYQDLEESNKELIEEGEEPEDPKNYKGQEQFLDLSKANFEWSDPKKQKKNNPNVPDLEPMISGSRFLAFNNLSKSAGIALVQTPWTPEDFLQNYEETRKKSGYYHYINITSSLFGDFYALEIPFSKVIDAITICPRRQYHMNPYSNVLDKGHHAVYDEANVRKSDYAKVSGMALTRKWDGKKFVDDNNTSSDFEVKKASLSRKVATPRDK